MAGLRLDFVYALRSLRRNPAYTGAVIILLGLGIGANTAMFSVLSGVLLRPLPQANGDRIVRLYQPNINSQTTGLSPLEMADYRAAAGSLEGIVEYHSMPFTFIGADEAHRLQTGVVSADFFDVMGLRPLLGRTFRPDEDQQGSDPVLVLSWEYWQRAFGGDPGVVGTTFRMNDRTHTVVGVLPRFPWFADQNDVYMPASSCPFRSAPDWAENRTARQPAFALLRAGISRDAALADLGTIAERLHAAYPEAYSEDGRFTITTVSLAELTKGEARPSVLTLLSATSLLLLIVCANVANLAMVRLLRHEEELATRLALGASRRHILRQIGTETGMLAAAGGALGLLIAYLSLGTLVPFLARFSARAYEIRIDGGVLAFAVFAALGAGLLGGLLPAAARLGQLGKTPGPGRRGGGNGRTTLGARDSRLRGWLVVAQVAVSFVLLVGAGLTVRSLINLQRVPPGFDPERVLTARVDLNWTRYASAEQMAAFFRSVEESLAGMPVIESVAFASSFPLNGDPASQIQVSIDSSDPGADAIRVAVNTVTSGYFEVLGVDLLRGRALEDADGLPDALLAMVITRASAERLFGDEDPIGRRISSDGGQSWGTIVGVVGDVRQDLEHDYEAMVFAHQHRFHSIQSRLLVRGLLPAPQLERVVRDAIAEVDREQPVTEVGTIREFRDAALAPRRVVTALLAGFAMLALVTTAVGLAGIIAFSVAERRKEIGIRVALGAKRTHVIGLVLRRALAFTAGGVAVGALLALLLTRLLATLLFGVPPTDVPTFAVVGSVLLVVSALAGALPVHRALRIDPVQAMRGP